MVDQKDYGIALIIPDNFSANLNAGEMIEVEMYRDPATTMPAGLLRKIVEGVAKGLVAQRTAKAKVEDILNEHGIILDEQWKSMTKDIEGQIEKAIEAQPRVNIREIAGKSRRFPTVYEQNVPAMTVMFAFFGITTLMFSVLSEHELGTFRRLASAPVSRVVIILGKVIPPAIVTYVQVLILFLFGYVVFRIQPGNIFAILLITLGLTMAVTGMASFLSTFVKTKRQAGGAAYTISLPLAALGGCMVPAWVMPETMRTVAKITPHYWAITAYQDIMVRGLGAAAVIVPVIVLLAFGLALMALGIWRIKLI
jgi:ABC-2 type transport system permease protein